MAALALPRLSLAPAGAVVPVAMLAVVSALMPTLAAAHGERAAPSASAAPEAWLVALLLVGALGYGCGIAALWRHAGRGRGVPPGRAAAFAAGWSLLVLALATPLDAAALQRFWLHMVQHELLMLGAAPLIVAGAPLVAWTWALPPPARRRIGALLRPAAWRRAWAALSTPLVATLLHGVAVWVWHVPACFDAALDRPVVHELQHASFFATALLFWWAALRQRSAAGQGVAMAAVLATMLHTGALGALLVFSAHAWYAGTPLADQQMGGLLMWLPGGLVYAGIALHFGSRWIGTERRLPAPAVNSL